LLFPKLLVRVITQHCPKHPIWSVDHASFPDRPKLSRSRRGTDAIANQAPKLLLINSQNEDNQTSENSGLY